MPEFRIEAFHNSFLPRGARDVQAVITVTAAGTGSSGGSTAAGTAPEDRSELLIVDVSGSMSGTKLRAAKQATSAAIDCIPDGVHFGIITGQSQGRGRVPAVVAAGRVLGGDAQRGQGGRQEVRGRGRDGHGVLDPSGGAHPG